MRNREDPTGDVLLRSGGVAALLFVDPKTVTRWAAAGRLSAVRTAGGHRRYLRSEVLALAAELRGGSDRPTPGHRAGRTDQVAASAALVAAAVDTARRQADAEAVAAIEVIATAATKAELVAAADAAAGLRSRFVAAQAAAHLVARSAVLDASRVERRAARTAGLVRRAADVAAAGLARTSRESGVPGADQRALLMSESVDAAARAAERDTRRAAVVVARGVAVAAEGVADTLAVLERSIEVEVGRRAAARRVLATAAADEVALRFAARSAGTATTARRAADALRATAPAARK